ncbi:MAG: lysine--tRNA ligase [Candidatus Marinimicrobia bacterium]|nr:lysine--tRNA ligase [Candidatus Neomarinimicrobiota bacterium]|tara:strand:+ start:12276 stop:13763 length:1488 start_codon:yes stop_codon:yes gene_type:complete
MSDNQKNLNEIKKFRLEKLKFLKDNNIDPFPHNFDKNNNIIEIKNDSKKYENHDISIAGRIISIRKMGKSSFLNVKDMSGKIQVYTNNQNLSNDEYDLVVRKLDIGDIVGIKGSVFYTKTQELSIKANKVELLSKNLHPLPNMKEKDGELFFSFDDKEQRYRKRYLDLIINDDSRDVFISRFNIINSIRNYLNINSFIEVETPVLQPVYGGANAKPFTTYHNSLDQNLFLRIADELYLKRLIVGGFEKVYEISKNFRNEGMDKNHNPEFTMLEFYSAYSDVYDMMELTEGMIKNLVKEMKLEVNGIDFKKNFDVFSFFDVLDKYSNIKISEMNTKEIHSVMKNNNIPLDKTYGYAKSLDKAFSFFVEPKLINPTFIINYPIELSPLAKVERNSNGKIVERFELFMNKMEIANSFSELNNPIDQKERFLAQQKLKDSGDEEAQVLDNDFIEALEVGMPPTGGVGIGIDRLVMILTNKKSIKDVILFPAMKNEHSNT